MEATHRNPSLLVALPVRLIFLGSWANEMRWRQRAQREYEARMAIQMAVQKYPVRVYLMGHKGREDYLSARIVENDFQSEIHDLELPDGTRFSDTHPAIDYVEYRK